MIVISVSSLAFVCQASLSPCCCCSCSDGFCLLWGRHEDLRKVLETEMLLWQRVTDLAVLLNYMHRCLCRPYLQCTWAHTLAFTVHWSHYASLVLTNANCCFGPFWNPPEVFAWQGCLDKPCSLFFSISKSWFQSSSQSRSSLRALNLHAVQLSSSKLARYRHQVSGC